MELLTTHEPIHSEEFVRSFGVHSICLQDNMVFFHRKSTPKEIDITNNVIHFLAQPVEEYRLFFFEQEPLTVCKNTNIELYFVLNTLLLESTISLFEADKLDIDAKKFSELYKKKFDEQFQLWCAISRKSVADINEYFRKYAIKFSIYISQFELLYKRKHNRDLSSKLLQFVKEHKTFNQKHINTGSQVVIYGAGLIGELLLEIFNNLQIQVSYFLDNFSNLEQYRNVPIYRTVMLEEKSITADCIIVTPTFDFEKIYNDLSQITDAKILSLQEIL